MSDLTPLEQAEQVGETLGLTELADGAVPPAVENWLARLSLLYGVPFEHLVPDATMLPIESIRFFYIDANWIEAMVDGAFSVGVHSQRDVRFHRLLRPAVRRATQVAAGKLRRDLRGEATTPEAAATDVRVRGGFLMRSEIVAGWPGLEVAGYASSDSSGTPIEILRLDRLAPDLLLCIFAEVPVLVVINEPPEGLHFGTGGVSVAPEMRQPGGRINLSRLARAIAGADNRQQLSGAGELAEEIVDSPLAQHFGPPPGGQN
ncbi:MAG: hypothetical protein OEW30_06235 [Acidimicrobiia bacterium]|nr:hypothetical protein [Acidimicrobiia bacterium]